MMALLSTAQRQGAEETVGLRFAVGAVETDG
jgi:hypothetical protein